MIYCFAQKNRIKLFFLNIVALVIFSVAGFYSLPAANAQGLWFSPFWNVPAVTAPRYPYDFLSPLYNRWSAGNGLLSSASLTGSISPLAPLRSAHASINGATTVFVPPSATNITVSVKQPGSGIPGIKLSALVPPITVFIYPSGYVPPAPATTPATILPTATTSPAVISAYGGLQQIFSSSYQPTPYQPAFSLRGTIPSPWLAPPVFSFWR